MSIYNKVFKIGLSIAFALGLIGPVTALAASPSLGAAKTYGVYAGTVYTGGAGTTINGDVGFSSFAGSVPLPLSRPSVTYPNYGAIGTYGTAGGDLTNALTALNLEPCGNGTTIPGFTFTGGAVVLSANLEHPSTTYTPGVYCASGGALSVGAGITLSGAGTYIFRDTSGALNAEGASIVATSSGASACDVFWTPNGATTINAGATFIGTVIPTSQPITLLDNVIWIGRALSFDAVTTGAVDTITVPGCSAPAARHRTVLPSPLISVTKIPTPLALPLGPESVTYNYEVSNIGPVAMSNVKIVDDSCSPVGFISGDTNFDSRLDTTETWKYSCTKLLSTTTTNIVTATGEANGFTAIDTAEATVVVGLPVVPPLIHVVKIPNIFLLPAGGGPVTYTYTVTNPGTAPLSNVYITDNKCTGLPGLALGNPGDLNHNNLLESNETWTFTCQTNITDTITNTATARGSANGFTAIDYALATVVVSAPILPNTGLTPLGESTTTDVIVILIIILVASYMVMKKRKF